MMKRLQSTLMGIPRMLVLFLLDFICISMSYWLITHRLFLVNAALYTPRFLSLGYGVMLVTSFAGRTMLQVNRQMWRYAQASAYLRMVLSGFIAGGLYLVVDRLFFTVHLSFAVAVAVFSTGTLANLSARFLYQALRRKPLFLHSLINKPAVSAGNKLNVAIVGAGEIGVLLARELLANRTTRYNPYCFFDNDPRKIGTSIEGIPVFGPDHDIVDRVNAMPIQDIIIALPNMSAETQKQVFETYKNTNCRVMLYDYPIAHNDKQEAKRTIREINIEDLLFRDMISLDEDEVIGTYRNRTVMVTGAGGSIGSELCRQLAKLQPKLLVMLDIYENGVYDIQQELKRKYGSALATITVIANICDAARMDAVLLEYTPDIVFHATAHKHVPLMESNCVEAVVNNVFGTYNVVNAAERAGVKRFVMISTDKAVNPTNIMGATKRMCEMIVQSRKDSATDFVAVRFGNVLGSNGSVVPLFKRQIAEGGPVTITDKRIIRYFMAIPEAAQLVIRTGSRGAKGELYVLDMGKPVRILDLAESMISLSGFVPYVDIDIQEVGLRPGEKLYEELLIKTENCLKTEDDRVFIERDEPISREQMADVLLELHQGLENGAGDEAVRALMMRLVPTYQPPDVVNATAAGAKEFKDVPIHMYTDSLLTPGIPG